MTTTSNLPQLWQARFPDTKVTDYLLAVPFADEKLITPPSFPSLPLSPSDHLIFSRGVNTEIQDATMASRRAGLVIRCIASTSSGARFFVKMAINLETARGSNSLQYFITREILAETRFYTLRISAAWRTSRVIMGSSRRRRRGAERSTPAGQNMTKEATQKSIYLFLLSHCLQITISP